MNVLLPSIMLTAHLNWHLISALQVDYVLSFGSRNGGFAFASNLRDNMASEFDVNPETIYLDAVALKGKDGTTEKIIQSDERSGETAGTAQLNPNWDTFYMAAMQEAPAMVFCLSKEWCESQYCIEASPPSPSIPPHPPQ